MGNGHQALKAQWHSEQRGRASSEKFEICDREQSRQEELGIEAMASTDYSGSDG